MAERRMMAKTIIDSDTFLDMPISTQVLYFHLNMRADDDGFVNNPKKIQRMVGCSDDDLKLLFVKSFVIPFESGVVVIKHWKVHNYIKKDRYKETIYKEEKKLLFEDENKVYQLWNQNGTKMEPQERLEKELEKEIGKERLGEDSIELLPAKQEPRIPYKEIVEYLNQRTGCNYKASTNKTQVQIKARFNEGFTLEDFKIVIDKKTNEWYGTEMQKYLRPETLFGTKFEGYLNQQEAIKPIGFKEASDMMDWEEIYDV